MPKFTVNTAIAYVNGPPHLGHALELIGADVIARWRRLAGDKVFYGTGTDEHGVKLYNTAKELGLAPQILCDQNAAKFAALKEDLHLSFDRFWRTTDQRHKDSVAVIWQKLVAAGDVYKKAYEALYCVGCETFKTKSELVEGKCPNHGTVPQLVAEENYFFRLSKYGPALIKYFTQHPEFVRPQSRYNEILNVIKSGLEDISISRHVHKLPWGVPVPRDPEQVMYVWVEALSNYITMFGYGLPGSEVEKWWPTDVNVIGKDIIRHHAAIWPAILLSIGEKLPRQVFAHGFITSGGQKMSKTMGNVIDPYQVLKTFGAEAMRYLLLRIVPFDDDGDVTFSVLHARYQADLANNLGNLVNRVLKMSERYFPGKMPRAVKTGGVWATRLETAKGKYQAAMAEYRFHLALEAMLACITELNVAVDQEKPWELAKHDLKKLEQVLYSLLESLRQLALWIAPFMPEVASQIYKALGLKLEETYTAKQYEKLQQWGGEKLGKKIGELAPLFPRLEEVSSD